MISTVGRRAAAIVAAFLLPTSAAFAGDEMRLAMGAYETPARDGLFIVGLEKESAADVGRIPFSTKPGQCVDDHECIHLERLPSKAASNRARGLGDPRPLYVSHIVRLRGSAEAKDIAKCQFLFSAYATSTCGEAQQLTLRRGDLSGEEWTAVEDVLATALEAEVARSGATHIILMSMGWKELQTNSIPHLADWSNGLGREFAGDRSYRPVYVGVTWPSLWGPTDQPAIRKNLSITNKIHDADEAGVGWVSVALNRAIAKVRARHPDLKVVLIGHSFGARLLSQAAYSWPTVSDTCNADLLIGLQGAFSSARYIPDKGVEGSPYVADPRYAACPLKAVYTSSKHDESVPFTIGQLFASAKYLLGPQPDKMLKKYSDYFELVTVESDGVLRAPPPSGKVLLVNADNLIADHNDVHDDKIARLIADAIRAYAPGPGAAQTKVAGVVGP